MDINITLFGEMITFAVLIWVTMKYIWPPIVKAMQARQQKIADGLEAAARAQRDLELAQKSISEQLRDARAKANALLDHANVQFNNIVEDAVGKSQAEAVRIIAKAKLEIEREIVTAKQQLQSEVAALVIQATEKILQQQVDPALQKQLIQQLILEI